MKTREQLVERALKKLKVIGAGQTATAAVTQSVDDMVDPMMADLGTRGIYAWGDEDEIADDAFEHLAVCLACVSGGDFGKSTVDDEPMDARRVKAETRLRLLNPLGMSYQPLQTEYF